MASLDVQCRFHLTQNYTVDTGVNATFSALSAETWGCEKGYPGLQLHNEIKLAGGVRRRDESLEKTVAFAA